MQLSRGPSGPRGALRHPWSPASRPSLNTRVSWSDVQSVRSPRVSSASRRSSAAASTQQVADEVPFARQCLGNGFSYDKHIRINRSKIACDRANARAPAFEGHSFGKDLRSELTEYSRGRCDAAPGSAAAPSAPRVPDSPAAAGRLARGGRRRAARGCTWSRRFRRAS